MYRGRRNHRHEAAYLNDEAFIHQDTMGYIAPTTITASDMLERLEREERESQSD